MATAENQLATTSTNRALRPTKNDTVNAVMTKISQLQAQGRLRFPAHYSPENALMSAYLVLQQTLTTDKKPVLKACTQESVANALLDMAVQGLNPMKKQCYFIAYGQQLVCQRSYFGTMAVAKRVTGCQEIFAEVVYEGDQFEYELRRGNKHITKHLQDINNVRGDKIAAAYCTIIGKDGQEYSEIMTIDQIKKAWAKSKMSPVDDKGNIKASSTHGQFPEEMAKKTVINRACKAFVNTSNDSTLDAVIEHFNRSDEVLEEAEFQEELEQHANQEVLDDGEIIEQDVVDAAVEQPEETAPQALKTESRKAEQPRLDGHQARKAPGF